MEGGVLSLFLLVTKRLYGKERERSIGQIKTCRKKQHVKTDDIKEMPDLICGKAAVGGNYISTRDNEAVKAIYEVFQRIYCLNPLGRNCQKGELIAAIVDFLMCRVMDVILLGFLSSTFIEICNSRTKDKSCNSKE